MVVTVVVVVIVVVVMVVMVVAVVATVESRRCATNDVIIVQGLLLLALLDALGVHLELERDRSRELEQGTDGIAKLQVAVAISTPCAGPDVENVFVTTNAHDETDKLVGVDTCI